MIQLQVGLIVDTADKYLPLSQLTLQAGHRLIYYRILSSTAGSNQLPGVQVWLLDISDDFEQDTDWIDELLQQNHTPVLLVDSQDKNNDSSWRKKIQSRLEQLAGDIALLKQKAAPRCWILAASTGGPAAIKTFLQALPPGLPTNFVYVQHIDPKQSESLARSLSKTSSYPCEEVSQGAVLSEGKLQLFACKERVEVLPNRTLRIHSQEQWHGTYSPSINQLVANIASVYKQDCGLIIFTGMGDDGAGSCRLVQQQGGNVWAQTPESSTSDSMPTAALATGCVSLSANPEALAAALTQHLSQFVRQNETKQDGNINTRR